MPLLALILILLSVFSSPLENEQYWAATWSSPPARLENLSMLYWLKGGDVGDLSVTAQRSMDPIVVRQALLRQKPGTRALFPWRYAIALFNNPLDRTIADNSTLTFASPWADHGTEAVRNEFIGFLSSLRARGIPVDAMYADIERQQKFITWNISTEHIEAIMLDPRFSNRPLKSGLTPHALLQAATAEEIKNNIGSSANLLWNEIMSALAKEAMEKALFEPFLVAYPEAEGSNYGSFCVLKNQGARDLNGHRQVKDNQIGTAGAFNAYGTLGQLATRFGVDPTDPTQLQERITPPLGATPWTAFLYEINHSRAVWRSNEQPFDLWIARKDYAGSTKRPSQFAHSPYYSENIFHQALSGAGQFLYWNPIKDGDKEKPAARVARFEEAATLNEILGELNANALGKIVKPLQTSRLAWDSSVVISGGLRIDEQGIWRITAAEDIRAVVINPGALRIEFKPNAPGTWLVMPAALSPVIQRIEHRTEPKPKATPEPAQ
jgi:hypothetical protein